MNVECYYIIPHDMYISKIPYIHLRGLHYYYSSEYFVVVLYFLEVKFDNEIKGLYMNFNI